ncbi:DegT/DnrJ/EryC1/StrS family aminotransferase [Streptomyces sp. NPDC004609]|uniref:DegT/DnrJ/EryC1/StrS family aminotransferase n=1 Tax=Streptomyces sp. NPDC004609 TaxID=3364704 RepID=UPI0036C688EA
MALGEGRPSAYTALEQLMRERLGRECLYVPSGRIALWLAMRHWCRPGGRVLMSPVNDDVIFFVALAAGLRPVMAPLRPEDGSIDVDAVPESVWHGLSAVLTTNLYGNPDPVLELRSRCHLLGIPLLEDCAHAIGTEIGGRPVGSFGDAAGFSLGKHTGAKTGGILAVADPALRRPLERARDELLEPGGPLSEITYGVRPYAEAMVRGLRLAPTARAVMRRLGMEEREDIRMALRPEELRRALPTAPSLTGFNSWVRVDMHDYRQRPGLLRLRRTERLLAGLDTRLHAYREGTRKLLASRWAIPRPGPVQPLFQVPLLVEDRDAARALLARHRIVTGYLYDPPLDDYAGEYFTDPSPLPQAAAYFGRHTLPCDPLKADRILAVLDRSDVRPAPPFRPGGPGGTPRTPLQQTRSSRTIHVQAAAYGEHRAEQVRAQQNRVQPPPRDRAQQDHEQPGPRDREEQGLAQRSRAELAASVDAVDPADRGDRIVRQRRDGSADPAQPQTGRHAPQHSGPGAEHHTMELRAVPSSQDGTSV